MKAQYDASWRSYIQRLTGIIQRGDDPGVIMALGRLPQFCFPCAGSCGSLMTLNARSDELWSGTVEETLSAPMSSLAAATAASTL
jgi:hypothetical protein